MSSTAPMELGGHEVQDERDRATTVAPEAAAEPSVASEPTPTQTQSPAMRAAPGAHQQPVNRSWVGIVLATFALYGGVLLWTAVAVSGSYSRWVISVGVMAVILALTFVAIGYAER